MQPVALFVLGLVLVVGIGVCGWVAEKKRRGRIRLFCASRGLTYQSGRDFSFDSRFAAFGDVLRHGSRRYARHQMTGEVDGFRLHCCEYHYETYSRDSKGRRSTHHHWSTLVLLRPSFELQSLCIRPEGLFDKLKGAFGWDDIDFASAEFSRAFHVSAPDRDWAYGVIQPDTMDVLMRYRGMEFRMEDGWLMVRVKRRLRVDALPGMIRAGNELLSGIPDFMKKVS